MGRSAVSMLCPKTGWNCSTASGERAAGVGAKRTPAKRRCQLTAKERTRSRWRAVAGPQFLLCPQGLMVLALEPQVPLLDESTAGLTARGAPGFCQGPH